jgi:hypothetical protein
VTPSEAGTPAIDASQAPQDSSYHADLANFVVGVIDKYRLKNHYKIAGGAITNQAAELCPELPSFLWRELDIVCFIFKPFGEGDEAVDGTEFKVDEESDSVVRKAIEYVLFIISFGELID